MVTTTRCALLVWTHFLLLAAGGAAEISLSRTSHGVTPVEKVIELLKKLSSQVEAEGKEEAAQYDKYACFCKEQADDKRHAIEKSTARIDKLDAQIQDLDGDIAALNGEILELDGRIRDYEKEVFAAVRVRRGEHKTYLVAEKNVSTAIYSAAMAIMALKDSKGQLVDAKLDEGSSSEGFDGAYAAPRGAESGPKWDWEMAGAESGEAAPWEGHGEEAPWLKWGAENTTASLLSEPAPAKKMPSKPPALLGERASVDIANLARSLLQVASGVASEKELRVLSNIASTDPGSPPRYTYASNDIIAVLQELYVKFKQSKQEIDETEFGLQRDFETKVQSIANQRKFAVQGKTQKEELVAFKTEEREAAAADKSAEEHERSSDEDFMEELKGDCETKAENWDQRSNTRSGELAAIAKALEYLQGDVSQNWGANKKLVGLQRAGRSMSSFLQLRSRHHRNVLSSKGATVEALQFLQKAAGNLHSTSLSVAATKVELFADHFAKVRSIIKDLMSRLEADALAEQGTKSYCDENMAAAVSGRDQASATLEDRAARISVLTASRKQLRSEIAAKSQEIADHTKALGEATELRSIDRADNQKTIAMSKEGKEAVQFALSVLTDFYGAALIQKSGYKPPNSDRAGQTVGDLAPDSWEGQYHGKQDASKGIIGVLQVILADFDRTESTVTSDEGSAQSEFETLERETNDAIDTLKEEVKTKQTQVDQATFDLTQLKSEKMDANKELASMLDELEKLHPMCVAPEESWEQRKLKREKEIEALKQAHAILEDWQK